MGKDMMKMKPSPSKMQDLRRALKSSSAAAAEWGYIQLRSRRIVKVPPVNSRARNRRSKTDDSRRSESMARLESLVEACVAEVKVEQHERSIREISPVTPPENIIRAGNIPPTPRAPRKLKVSSAVKMQLATKLDMTNSQFDLRLDD